MEQVLPDSEKITFHTEKFCSSMQDLLYFCAEPVPNLELFWVKPVKKSPCITRYFLQNTSSSPGNLQVHTRGDDSKTYFHAVPQTRQEEPIKSTQTLQIVLQISCQSL